MVHAHLVNPTPHAFVILSAAPPTRGAVFVSWRDGDSGNLVTWARQHPFYHVIEPYSAGRLCLESPGAGETIEFPFDLVADAGTVRCDFVASEPEQGGTGAGSARLRHRATPMIQPLEEAIVMFTEQKDRPDPVVPGPVLHLTLGNRLLRMDLRGAELRDADFGPPGAFRPFQK
jgi:hypothetical protein